MAFYKYGLSFLAGTGFGAAVTSICHRRGDDRCPLHKEKHRRRRRRHGDAGAHTGGSDEHHDNRDNLQERGNEKGKRCLAMKDGGKENKGGQTTGKEEASD